MDQTRVEVKTEANQEQCTMSSNKYAGLKPAWKMKSLSTGKHASRPLPSAYTERHQDIPGGLKYENDEMKKKHSHALTVLKSKGSRAKKSQKEHRQLDYLRSTPALIRMCKEAKTSDKRNMHFQELREHLHSLEVFTPLTQELVDQSKLLGKKALPAIMDAPRGFYPSDIYTDAGTMYKKLSSGNLDNSVYRGMKFGEESRGWSRVKSYQYGSKASFAGEGHLRNGQWWPSQVCTLRDGAHGQIEAGIYYLQPEAEAISIVLNGNPKYTDVDNGDYIEYWSTDGHEGEPSKPTRGLLRSYEKKTPIRVLRASGLPPTNKYRPEKGYRYDGLYLITDYNLADADKTTQRYKFSLKRLPIQTPIRFEGVAKRPTKHEIQAYNRERKLYGL